jgi:hypothetical protein
LDPASTSVTLIHLRIQIIAMMPVYSTSLVLMSIGYFMVSFNPTLPAFFMMCVMFWLVEQCAGMK